MQPQGNQVDHQTVQTADGVVLPVVQAGRRGAPALVLVHGLASSHRVWEPLMAQPELLAHYHLIAFDLRGHGEHQMPPSKTRLTSTSSRGGPGRTPTGDDDPEQPADFSATSPWVQDLNAVLDVVDVGTSVHLVGWSFGSTVVQAWMHDHRGLDTAAGAMLISGPNVLGTTEADESVAALVGPNALTVLAEAAEGGASAFADLILSRGEDDRRVDAEARRVAEEDARQSAPAAVAAALTYSFDHRAFLWGLPVEQRARITALVCEQDQVFHAPALEALWAQAGVRSRVLSAQPHALPLVDPDLLAAELLAQLETLDLPRSTR